MASGIIEKSNKGLFENDIEFRGEYARYATELKDGIKAFKTIREIYVISAAIGLAKNLKSSEYTGKSDFKERSIFSSDLNSRKADLTLIYRMIMLLEETDGFEIKDYMNRAFKDDANEEDRSKLKENMGLFNSYACGGLEYLYSELKDCDTQEKTVDKLYEIFKEFTSKSEDEMPDWEPEF